MSILATLDPSVRKMLDQAADAPPWNTVPIGEARESFLNGAVSAAGTSPELACTEDRTIPGLSGPIPARLYVPKDAPIPCPTMLYFHGGGFVMGSIDSHDALCRHLCAVSGVQILSIGYRLAPEHKFPAALDDALTAARWLLNNFAVINADPGRLAIGGDSAGANLATSVCRFLSPLETPAFRHQTLIYPMVDLRLTQPSIAMFGHGYRLTADILRWFADNYVRKSDTVNNPRISPLLADDLSTLPPALVITAGFDPLRDEGNAYAKALTQAGVVCQHKCFTDMIHGFCNMPGSVPRAHDAYALVGEALRQALA